MQIKMPRRLFIGATAAAMAAPFSLAPAARSAEAIPGFDQTKTDYDKTKVWKPFSDRKIRVGLVGYGLCQFSAQFEFQNHPNVEVVAVSDLFPDPCDSLLCRRDPQQFSGGVRLLPVGRREEPLAGRASTAP